MNPIEYLRSWRFGEYAVFDFVLSFLVVFVLAPFLSKGFRKFGLVISRVSWLYLTLPLSIVIHLAVGVMTPMTIQFLDPNGYYGLKIVIVFLCVMGLKDVKRVT